MAVLATPVPASEFLAPGNPPLTRAVADSVNSLLAWVLEAAYTPELRDQFTKQMIANWPKADASTIRTYQQLADAQKQLMQMTPEQREQVRQTLRPQLAALLGPSQPSASSQPASNVPAVLIGTWGTGSMSSMSFVDRTTGSSAPASGTQLHYKFMPDGRYEYASLTTQSMYSCTTKLSLYIVGKVAFQGNSLTFQPESGTFTSRDSCNAQYNYEKPAKLDHDTYNWRMEQDQYGQKMCLQNAKINGCAYKR